jgi:hypothetical protein
VCFDDICACVCVYVLSSGEKGSDALSLTVVHKDGLLHLLQQLLHLPITSSATHHSAAAGGAVLCHNTCARRIVRALESLSGYASAKTTPKSTLQHSQPAHSRSGGGVTRFGEVLVLPQIVVQHTSGTRSYKIERLLADAAALRGGFVSVCGELLMLLNSIHSSSERDAAAELEGGGGRREGGALVMGGNTGERGGGGLFFIQSLAPNSNGSSQFFDSSLVQTQMKAACLVEAAQVGGRVLPVRIRMRTFW